MSTIKIVNIEFKLANLLEFQINAFKELLAHSHQQNELIAAENYEQLFSHVLKKTQLVKNIKQNGAKLSELQSVLETESPSQDYKIAPNITQNMDKLSELTESVLNLETRNLTRLEASKEATGDKFEKLIAHSLADS